MGNEYIGKLISITIESKYHLILRQLYLQEKYAGSI